MPSDWTFVSVDLELTNRCRNNCLMCPREAITRSHGIMQKDTFKTVAQKLINEGSLIAFSGMGDPLLHPMIFDWIRDIRRRGGDVGIVVNPASLRKEHIRELIESGPNFITLSFPSLRKDVFERLCPEVSFDIAIERSELLIRLARGNVGLNVTGILTELNRDERDTYGNFWRETGIPSRMVSCHGRGGNLRLPDIYEPEFSVRETGVCGLFRFHTFITWEGEVLACCHDLTAATRIGNLVQEEISVIAERKRKLSGDSMPFPVCRGCDEPLRLCPLPSGFPPENRKERRRFFRTVSRKCLT
ncbi:MAG: radical SAM protein [Candidatus Brocadiaceae bacterium]|nr:radical SAM protein [Candidatus Brocadiaceae bacterium]